MYTKFVKRVLDITFALVLLIVFFPVFCIIYIAIKIDSEGSGIFIQKRVGKDGRIFNIYKFRTMKGNCPNNTPTHLLLEADTYITKLGKWLRKYSVDELPQIYNVLRGDMSFIGPRPVLPKQREILTERHKFGASGLRPGITGYAQINGRDELNAKEKIFFDKEYVSKVGFIFDIKILLITIIKIIRKEGIIEGSPKRRVLQNEKSINYRAE